MSQPGSGTQYLYRCTGETEGEQHDYPVYGMRDKLAMDSRIADDWARCDCGSPYKRVYSFQAVRPMPEHFNLAAGTFVRTERELNDVYKRKSDEASERTGILHEFQPVSQSEKQALNVTSQGLSDTVKRREKSNMRVTDTLRKAAED